jgi:diphthamide synthase (EF-2-diphthine--ammonia ligase)
MNSLNKKKKALLFWSGGMSSALALDLTKELYPDLEVIGLLTFIDGSTNRVAHHGISDTLMLDQAKLLKLPLQRIFFQATKPDELITTSEKILSLFNKKGIDHLIFGTTQFADLPDSLFKDLNLKSFELLFPLSQLINHSNLSLKEQSKLFSDEFFKRGFKALITGVHTEYFPNKEILSKEYNLELVEKLDDSITPFASQNEFHTFVTFGPGFKMRVPYSKAIAEEDPPYLVSLIKEL